MANIISAADILAETGGGGYYSKTDKEKLHAEQRAFWITNAIAEKDGNFGPQTIFAIREKNGNEGMLAFGVSPSRIEIAKKISQALANGADASGPWYLGRWQNGTRSGWVLTHEQTTPVEITDQVDDTRSSTDDDVPF